MNETPNISPAQALNNLYAASRKAPLNADDHELLRASALVLDKLILEQQSKPTEESE